MGASDPWGAAVPDYHRRLVGWRRPAARADPVAVGLRVAAGTAAAVVCACLVVAVPCGVFAAVGLWFGDASTGSAAALAAATGSAAVLAAVPVVACQRFAARSTARGVAQWN